MRHAFDGCINVSVRIYDDGVFAAHFKNCALDPQLAGGLVGGNFVDVKTDFARSRERDKTRLGMRDDSIAESGSGTGAEIHHAFGHAGLFQNVHELGGDCRRIAGRLQDHGVAADDRGQSHSGHDGARKIPRRNHRAYTQGNVDQGVALAG